MAVDEGAKRREKKTHSRVDAMGENTYDEEYIFESCILFMHLTYLLLQAKKEEVFDGSCPGDRGSSRAPLSTDASGFSGSELHIAPCGGAHVSIL